MNREESFRQVFPEKSIIGMIHLAGNSGAERVSRALEEIEIYQEAGVNGALIEDYHGRPQDVCETLRQILIRGYSIARGVNILRNPYSSFRLASQFGAKFIQFDSVQTPDLNLGLYDYLRKQHPNLVVLGGIGFKYTRPTGNILKVDLEEGRLRCEAIVTTGSGTGIETPTEKLMEFRELLGGFPLVVGAGVNLENVREQLQICDGAIIGSYFKPNGNTFLPVDRGKVKDLMGAVRTINF